ncbi:GNAT family N-acetyltransferase [Brevibacillus ginsengisoli]|uniref:GNAT family N-acetyltransferase n=1 Tax=Brevibacillus ginsengisoli TaxID=363854 RepID=UPI003CEBB609
MKQSTQSWSRADGYTITTEKSYLQIDVIHQFLSVDSYWAKGISKELVVKAVENSGVCYGIYKGNPSVDPSAKQVGFARVVTDFVRYAWVGDVFVLPAERGTGLSKWLMSVIVEHPLLKGTSFNLGTKDAHTLYQQFGFQSLANPENRLQRPVNWELIYEGHGCKEPASD